MVAMRLLAPMTENTADPNQNKLVGWLAQSLAHADTVYKAHTSG
jgi:hypothetical protein